MKNNFELLIPVMLCTIVNVILVTFIVIVLVRIYKKYISKK